MILENDFMIFELKTLHAPSEAPPTTLMDAHFHGNDTTGLNPERCVSCRVVPVLHRHYHEWRKKNYFHVSTTVHRHLSAASTLLTWPAFSISRQTAFARLTDSSNLPNPKQFACQLHGKKIISVCIYWFIYFISPPSLTSEGNLPVGKQASSQTDWQLWSINVQ